jgi:hypothetical protein
MTVIRPVSASVTRTIGCGSVGSVAGNVTNRDDDDISPIVLPSDEDEIGAEIRMASEVACHSIVRIHSIASVPQPLVCNHRTFLPCASISPRPPE